MVVAVVVQAVAVLLGGAAALMSPAGSRAQALLACLLLGVLTVAEVALLLSLRQS